MTEEPTSHRHSKSGKKISRRDLLKGLGLAAMGVAAAGLRPKTIVRGSTKEKSSKTLEAQETLIYTPYEHHKTDHQGPGGITTHNNKTIVFSHSRIYENNNVRRVLSAADFDQGFNNDRFFRYPSNNEEVRVHQDHPYISVGKRSLSDGKTLITMVPEDGTCVRVLKIDTDTDQVELINDHPITKPDVGMAPVIVTSEGIGYYAVSQPEGPNRVMKLSPTITQETILKGGKIISGLTKTGNYFVAATQAEDVNTVSFVSNDPSLTKSYQYAVSARRNSCPDVINHHIGGAMCAWIDLSGHPNYGFFNPDNGSMSGIHTIPEVTAIDVGGTPSKGELIRCSYNPDLQDQYSIKVINDRGKIINIPINYYGDPSYPHEIGPASVDKAHAGTPPLKLVTDKDKTLSTKDASYVNEDEFTNNQIFVENKQVEPTPTATVTQPATETPQPTPTQTTTPTTTPTETPKPTTQPPTATPEATATPDPTVSPTPTTTKEPPSTTPEPTEPPKTPPPQDEEYKIFIPSVLKKADKEN